MKRYGNLYHKICDLNNIKLAHKNARKGKTHYDEVKQIDLDVEKYALKIQDMLINKTFVNSEYTVFIKNDKGKDREIYKLPYFPDRIIHHAIMQILEPIWRKTLIADTYQSIKGRGIHKAKRRVEKATRSKDSDYCLKVDVKKFYPSINNDVLKETVKKKIKCKDTLWLLYVIIESIEGLPIGNYISQYLGNLVLTDIDHKMKEKHKIKYYFRYCDDIVLIHKSKQFLHLMLSKLNAELNKLDLHLKHNYQIFPIEKRGIDFVGFVFYKKYTKIRKSIKINFFKHLKTGDERLNSISSYFGWIKEIKGKSFWINSLIRSNLTNEAKLLLGAYKW